MNYEHGWYRQQLRIADEVYRNLLGRPLIGTGDVEGVSLRFFQQREHGFDRERLEASVRESEEYKQKNPPTPIPPNQNVLSRLRVVPGSRWFHHQSFTKVAGSQIVAAPFDYREATAMGLYRLWLDGDMRSVDEFVGYLGDERFNAARILLNLDSDLWRERGRQNSYREGARWFDQLVPFTRYMGSRGFYARICVVGGVRPFGVEPEWRRRPDVVSASPQAQRRMVDHARTVAGLLRDEENVSFEVANEAHQIGFGEQHPVILEIGGAIREAAPNALLNLTQDGDEDATYWARSPADFLDEHFSRRDEWDGFASIKRIWEHFQVDIKNMPVVSGEWMNFGLGGMTSSTATAFCCGAALRIKQVIPAFHAASFVWVNRLPSDETTACVRAWHLGCDMVPMDFGGQKCNGNWDCSPVDADEFPPSEASQDGFDGPIRVHGRRNGDRYIGVSLREPAGHELQGNFKTDHLEQWGDWQSRLLTA